MSDLAKRTIIAEPCATGGVERAGAMGYTTPALDSAVPDDAALVAR